MQTSKADASYQVPSSHENAHEAFVDNASLASANGAGFYSTDPMGLSHIHHFEDSPSIDLVEELYVFPGLAHRLTIDSLTTEPTSILIGYIRDHRCCIRLVTWTPCLRRPRYGRPCVFGISSWLWQPLYLKLIKIWRRPCIRGPEASLTQMRCWQVTPYVSHI